MSKPPEDEHEARKLALAETALVVFLSESLNANTRAARKSDFTDLCQYLVLDPVPAIASLLDQSAGELRVFVDGYLTDLRKRKLSDATVNRRLINLRGLFVTCRLLGADIPDPKLFITGVRVTPYRDTRGPGGDAIAQLLDSVDRNTVRGKRDYGLLCLLYFEALRRGEVLHLDIEDVNLKQKRVRILGKGKGTQYQWLSIQEETAAALQEHIAALGKVDKKEPVFRSLSHVMPAGTRLTGNGLWRIVVAMGWEIVGEHIRPHALRHTAITEALDRSGGDMRRVQGYSRHARGETLRYYDDSLRDDHEEIGSLVADAMKQRREK